MKKITLLALCFFGIALQAQILGVDNTFNAAGTGFNETNAQTYYNSVKSLALQSDGKIIAGGYFNSYNGLSRNNLVRLNADGSLDESFDTGTGANEKIYKVVVLPDDKILIAGDFTMYNGLPANHIARLYSNGNLDTTFNLMAIVNTTETLDNLLYPHYITDVVFSSDGKIYISGNCNFNFSGNTRIKIARINSDGSFDASFNPTIIPTGPATFVQPDNKLLVGGTTLQRYNPDGSYDTGFISESTISSGQIRCVYMHQDKIYVGGIFNTGNTPNTNNYYDLWARLNEDGTNDASFERGSAFINSSSGGAGINNIIPFGNTIIFLGQSYGRRLYIRKLDGTYPYGYSFPDSSSPASYAEFNTGLVINETTLIIGGRFYLQDQNKYQIMRLGVPELGINNSSKVKDFIVYNSKSDINFKSSNNINIIAIYDVTGRQLYKSDVLNTSNTSISMTKSNQVLLYNVTLSNGQVIKGKLIH